MNKQSPPRGRGSTINPSGRFERLAYDDADLDVVQHDEFDGDTPRLETEYYRDTTASIEAARHAEAH